MQTISKSLKIHVNDFVQKFYNPKLLRALLYDDSLTHKYRKAFQSRLMFIQSFGFIAYVCKTVFQALKTTVFNFKLCFKFHQAA